MVVPVRNGASTIGEQLEALSNQAYGGEWEVVVADNGSGDGTAAVVHEWAARLPRLTLVDASERRGPGFARNRGARRAEGDFLAFCDADDVVGPGWLAALAAGAREYDIVAGVLEAGVINPGHVAGWRPPRSLQLPRSGFLPFAPSGNFGVWSHVFADTGGFDERYGQSEDVEWSWRAQLSSYTLGLAPGAVVHYRYRSSARGVAAQAFGRGVASVRLYRDYRGRGAVRAPLGRAARRWAWLLVRLPYLFSATRRGTWLRRAGESAGRFVGSLRFRVVCL